MVKDRTVSLCSVRSRSNHSSSAVRTDLTVSVSLSPPSIIRCTFSRTFSKVTPGIFHSTTIPELVVVAVVVVPFLAAAFFVAEAGDFFVFFLLEAGLAAPFFVAEVGDFFVFFLLLEAGLAAAFFVAEVGDFFVFFFLLGVEAGEEVVLDDDVLFLFFFVPVFTFLSLALTVGCSNHSMNRIHNISLSGCCCFAFSSPSPLRLVLKLSVERSISHKSMTFFNSSIFNLYILSLY
mmetsp:Transcript_46358/g.52680  ORF Transcript_46358/g.52680 Transcript_46358/m.52680 type:complete len:234 (+) Transcript_46358:210-911(+)